jgi:hypothetical protein
LEVTIFWLFSTVLWPFTKNFREWIDRFLGKQISSYILGLVV